MFAGGAFSGAGAEGAGGGGVPRGTWFRSDRKSTPAVPWEPPPCNGCPIHSHPSTIPSPRHQSISACRRGWAGTEAKVRRKKSSVSFHALHAPAGCAVAVPCSRGGLPNGGFPNRRVSGLVDPASGGSPPESSRSRRIPWGCRRVVWWAVVFLAGWVVEEWVRGCAHGSGKAFPIAGGASTARRGRPRARSRRNRADRARRGLRFCRDSGKRAGLPARNWKGGGWNRLP